MATTKLNEGKRLAEQQGGAQDDGDQHRSQARTECPERRSGSIRASTVIVLGLAVTMVRVTERQRRVRIRIWADDYRDGAAL